MVIGCEDQLIFEMREGRKISASWRRPYSIRLRHDEIHVKWRGTPFLACENTIWLFNIAMGNDPFIDGLPIKNGDFPWLC